MYNVESQGAVDVIKPMAPMSQDNSGDLMETVEAKLSKGQSMVVLDMSDIPLIDSAGLESLLDVQDSLRSRGGIMKLAAIPQLCQEILRITGVEQQFESHYDVKTAVRSFVQ